jgi:hypothetical protein
MAIIDDNVRARSPEAGFQAATSGGATSFAS